MNPIQVLQDARLRVMMNQTCFWTKGKARDYAKAYKALCDAIQYVYDTQRLAETGGHMTMAEYATGRATK